MSELYNSLSGTDDEPVWVSTFFPNSAYVRLWRLVVRIFLFFGLLGALDQAWRIGSELEARYTWPTANGQVVSSDIKDDKDMPGKITDGRHTHYWVEYEVRFAVSEDQCRTGVAYSGPPDSMPCVGTVRTRSTLSPGEAWQWMRSGYGGNASVNVLHNPSGPEIKITGSSIWLFYPWTKAVMILVWVVGFSLFHVFLQRRLSDLQGRPESEAASG